MAGWLFLFVTVVGFGFTVNAFKPQSNRRSLNIPSFLFSWLTMELAAHHLAWQLCATAAFVALGALDGWPGWAGLAVSGMSWFGLVLLVLQGLGARHVVAAALAGYAAGPPTHQIRWWHLLVPIPLRRPGFRKLTDIEYGRAAGRRLRLDVFVPREHGRLRPAVVQIHGGAWVMGDKRTQGIPLLSHMAERGWVGFNVNYRLCPGATFPEPLVDIKRAIAWIKEHAEDFGVDPSFIAVTGGSAGGHLAALAALTVGDERYQPGFESADTSVQACAPIYGALDLTNRLGSHRPGYVSRFIGPIVVKAFFEEEPERFAEASPTDRVHAGAPPFLVVHGDRDTLTPLDDARLFVESLRRVSENPVLFAEIRGAQHAFDVFLSPRSAPVIEGVEAFFAEARRRLAVAKTSARGSTPEPAGLEPARSVCVSG